MFVLHLSSVYSLSLSSVYYRAQLDLDQAPLPAAVFGQTSQSASNIVEIEDKRGNSAIFSLYFKMKIKN